MPEAAARPRNLFPRNLFVLGFGCAPHYTLAEKDKTVLTWALEILGEGNSSISCGRDAIPEGSALCASAKWATRASRGFSPAIPGSAEGDRL